MRLSQKVSLLVLLEPVKHFEEFKPPFVALVLEDNCMSVPATLEIYSGADSV